MDLPSFSFLAIVADPVAVKLCGWNDVAASILFGASNIELRISERVGPRHGANSGGGNETHFRPAGGLKNIVYENRGVFDKFIIL